ncbi:hypothetical protein N7G274_006707 [Stereocaulon virgatum]|uniref:Uncharacterized protein n=1 Tax=Stereocaulon virgatum TaxID=373712 RepID=A0ABR4A6R3_9LECA
MIVAQMKGIGRRLARLTLVMMMDACTTYDRDDIQKISWFAKDVENSQHSAYDNLLFLSVLVLLLPNWDGQGSSFGVKTIKAAPESGPFDSVHANSAILALMRLLVSTSPVNDGLTSSTLRCTPLHSTPSNQSYRRIARFALWPYAGPRSSLQPGVQVPCGATMYGV